MYNQNNRYRVNISDILYGSYIRYDRLYEMTKYAFYGKNDSNDVNIFIDVSSIVRSLYTKGDSLQIDDSCSIASCIINLAIHIRAYFETRHKVNSKIYIIYGGARPREAFVNYYLYNQKNILMEDYNIIIKNLIKDNLDVINILCPYLHDIFCIIDYENEFSVISSAIIDKYKSNNPNIIYSKELLSYQLVAFKPMTFLYRPKKQVNNDNSWVVTKSTLYNAYRYGELNITKEFDTALSVEMFSIYQAISGVKSRSLNSIKNANNTIKLLTKAIENNIFFNGYNFNSIIHSELNSFEKLFNNTNVNFTEVVNRFAAIDLQYQTMLYKSSINAIGLDLSIINLYNPQEIRNINDKYFQKYPLDLNRV